MSTAPTPQYVNLTAFENLNHHMNAHYQPPAQLQPAAYWGKYDKATERQLNQTQPAASQQSDKANERAVVVIIAVSVVLFCTWLALAAGDHTAIMPSEIA